MPVAATREYDVPTPPLVGRERERDILRACLDEALAGRGGLVLLNGEAGVGKSALAEDVCHEAAARGATTLTGHCYDLTETPPYGPWREMYDCLGMLLAGMPDAPAISAPDFSDASSQAAMFAQAQAFLAAFAARRPLVLLVEDCHWADAASLDLLRFLAREIAALPVLLLVTFRGDELAQHHPLYTLVPLIEREARAVCIEVRRLDRDAVRILVSGQYPIATDDTDRLVIWLDARANGNAFFTTQLLHALVEANILCPAGERWALGDLAPVVVPLRLRQVIDARALRLDEGARALLAVAALLGQEVPFALWGAVVNESEERLYAVAEEAIAARLVEASADGSAVRFMHALVREALYEGMLPFRRRALHRQIGEQLAAMLNPDPDAVAYHFQRAGDERSMEWLLRAGERAERSHAWLMAAERYAAAAQQLAGSEEASRRGGLLIRVALQRRYADIRQSIALVDEAVQLGDGRDAALVAFGTFVQGWLQSMTMLGDRDGTRQMESGIAALELLPASERAQLAAQVGYSVEAVHCRAVLVYQLAACGRFREARTMGESPRSQELSSLVSSTLFDDPRACLEFGIGQATAALGQPDAAHAPFARARARFRARGQFQMLASCTARHLGWLHLTYTTDDLAERDQLIAEMAEALAMAAPARTEDTSRMARLHTAFLEGAWDDIATTAPELVSNVSWQGRVNLAQLAHARGEHERAWEHIRVVFPHGPPDPPGNEYRLTLWLIRVAIALALDTEDRATAHTWLAAHDRWQAWSGCIPWRAEGELLWARYESMLGHRMQAQEHAERALAFASEPRQPLALLTAHRTLGEFATEAGDHTAAHQHLDTALALATACRAPYERALTLLALAELDTTTGDTMHARSALDEARTICVPLGAQPALDRADALTTRLTANPARPALPAGLTAREVAVLRLVAQGLTNAQVAQQLFISPRTVDYHLRSIYGKVGVTSRAGATRFAVEHGLN